MSISDTCVKSFVSNFLKDLGVSQSTIDKVLSGIDDMIEAFNNAKSSDSISSILNDLIDCSKRVINDAFVSASTINASMVAAIAILSVVCVVIISLALVYATYTWTFIAIVIVIVLYIIGIFFIVRISRNTSLAVVTNAENRLLTCISTAEDRLRQFEQNQIDALSAAFCAYPG